MCCSSIILCIFSLDKALNTPFGSVMFPMEHRRALEQEAEREGTHETQTTSLSLTDSWCRVIGNEKVRNLRTCWDALFRTLFVIGSF